MIVGMDFGTTNSGMSVYDGRQLQVLPLDPQNSNPNVLRSALYITNSQNVLIGRGAVDQYYEHNIGRPVKLQRVWIGEIEVIADEVRYIQDAYVWTDVLSPGRLLLSIKTSLRDPDYVGTVIGPYHYSLENLIATYLHLAKIRAERLLDRELTSIVLGRPVRFAFDPQHDRLAQSRLLEAALRAGYEQVYFQYEPVAAAYHFAINLEAAQNILVFDFGGGTLDVTVMRAEPSGRREVLATGGIPVAGDVFDEKLIRAKLPEHFGAGGTYGSATKPLPIPLWIYDTFANWQTIVELQTPQNREMLQTIAATARRPKEIEALISLVTSNYGLKMFDAVELTKRTLSERVGGMIKLQGPGFNIHQLVTRSEFEQIILNEVDAINIHLDEIVSQASLRPEQIDVVIRTGGSSQIPIFQKLLREKFGGDKVRSVDTFSSVTSGLGVVAHELESGRADLQAYSRADLKSGNTRESQPPQAGIQGVNLELIKRRLQAHELEESDPAPVDRLGHILLTRDFDLLTTSYSRAALHGSRPIDHPFNDEQLASGVQAQIIAPLDDAITLITSHYRFLMVTVSQLLDLKELGLTLNDLHPLGNGEQVTALAHWSAIRDEERLVFITMRGFVRKYMTPTLRERMEGPVPFVFDKPLLGWPFALIGGSARDDLILTTELGRALRLPVKAVPTRGGQGLNKERDERLIGAHILPEKAEMLILSDDGAARRLQVAQVSRTEKSGQKPKIVAFRKTVIGSVAYENCQWALASGQLLPLHSLDIDLSDSNRLEPTRYDQLLGAINLPQVMPAVG